MAKILDKNLSVALGNCIHVLNVEKQNNPNLKEDDVFICIQVENESGDKEYSIHMTQSEMDSLKKGNLSDMDKMIFGRIYHKFIVDTNYYCVKLRDNSGDVYVGIFNIAKWSSYYKRAVTHPMSCTKKSLWTDLFD